MRTFHKTLSTVLLSIFTITAAFSQSSVGESGEKVVTFRFVPGDDMFYIPWGGNDAELNRLYDLVDQYRAEITAGLMPVYVDGYSVSMGSAERNRELAFIRANRVKSELITHKGLVEDNFVTTNRTTAFVDADGTGHKDLVVVTLRIAAREEPAPEPEPVVEQQPEPAPEPVVEPQPVPQPVPIPEPVAKGCDPYCFAVRTNLLYDAFLLPTLGVEWRVNETLGVKLDGSYSFWGDEHGKVQKIWLANPEVRWYMGASKRFYVGLGGNYAEYNVYDYLIGGLFSDDTGYQGTFWSAGATVGYQLYLSRSFSLDFNLGLGYLKSEYDSFNMVDGVRVYKDKNKSKGTFGPTQAGVNLIWTLGGNK